MERGTCHIEENQRISQTECRDILAVLEVLKMKKKLAQGKNWKN
jgi:hypothetical protein